MDQMPIQLHKWLKNDSKLISSNSAACVCHSNVNHVVGSYVAPDRNFPAVPCKLYSIGEKIQNNLCKPIRVRMNNNVYLIRWNKFVYDSLSTHLRLYKLTETGKYVMHRNIPHLILYLARVQLAEVQNVGNQRQQILPAMTYALQSFLLPLTNRPVQAELYQLYITCNCVKRCSQLMRHCSQKFCLCFI